MKETGAGIRIVEITGCVRGGDWFVGPHYQAQEVRSLVQVRSAASIAFSACSSSFTLRANRIMFLFCNRSGAVVDVDQSGGRVPRKARSVYRLA
jgi:hypothetical protein